MLLFLVPGKDFKTSGRYIHIDAVISIQHHRRKISFEPKSPRRRRRTFTLHSDSLFTTSDRFFALRRLVMAHLLHRVADAGKQTHEMPGWRGWPHALRVQTPSSRSDAVREGAAGVCGRYVGVGGRWTTRRHLRTPQTTNRSFRETSRRFVSLKKKREVLWTLGICTARCP